MTHATQDTFESVQEASREKGRQARRKRRPSRWLGILYKLFVLVEILFVGWLIYEFVVLYALQHRLDWHKQGSVIIVE